MTPRRNIPIFRLLIAVVIGVLPYSARAARSQPASEIKSLHEWATLETSYLGTTVEPIPLQAGTMSTAVVLRYPFNTGSVDLVALLRNGKTTGTIDVSVSGYKAGLYTVSAVTASSTSTVVLGTLTVTTGTFPIWSGTSPIFYNTAAATPAIIAFPPWGVSSGSAVFGGKAAPFPGGFSPFDVATLSLSDSNGNVVTTAVLTPVPSGYYTALSPLIAGTAAPGAAGFALIHAEAPPRFLPMAMTASTPSIAAPAIPGEPILPISGPITGRLAIHAHGLPASTTLTYAADGVDLGTVTTDASGNLTLFAAQGPHRKLPSTLDLFSVNVVTLHDSSGTIFMTAGFSFETNTGLPPYTGLPPILFGPFGPFPIEK